MHHKQRLQESRTARISTDVRLGGAQLELDETNLGLFDGSRASVCSDHILVKYTPFHELCIFNGSANLSTTMVTNLDKGSHEIDMLTFLTILMSLRSTFELWEFDIRVTA